MTLKSLLPLSTLSLALLAGTLLAATPGTPQTQPARAPGGRNARGPAAPANLGGAMNSMQRSITALKAEATDPAKMDQTFHDIATFQRDVAIAKMQNPPINRLPEADRATGAASYRTMLSNILKLSLELETAVSDKKTDDIKKILAQIEEIETAGHSEFKVGQ